MIQIHSYLEDGANHQVQAVLPFIKLKTDLNVMVSRWENCREQGYVFQLRSKDYSDQLNIAIFEHRNSDRIHAVKWKQVSTNSLNIDTAEFGDIYKDKFDTSFSVEYGSVVEMSDWVVSQFEMFAKD